jgi:hypothetical protein
VAENVLISNCANNILIESGGSYSFTHCTVVSYSNNYIQHKTPVLDLANFPRDGGTAPQNLQALFTNCIFWGDNGYIENEITVNKQGINSFNVLFNHCLYKAAAAPANATFTSGYPNQDPLFDSIDNNNHYYDFRQRNAVAAPGINKGISTGVTKDLDDNSRTTGLPDLGCYEKL